MNKGEIIVTDQEVADDVRKTLDHFADLMNEAKKRDIVLNWNINEADIMDGDAVADRKFVAFVLVQKLTPL